jgi:leader peptidase (prepilin peptidase)/N-methyltransferase
VTLLILLAVVLGLAVGSFLNVVIWRVPRGESVVRPPSACPACGHRIRARDNVPVLGWLLLRGRCRDCGAPISARYPLVEAGTGALFGLVAWRFVDQPWALPAFLYLGALAVALALIDLDVHRLPDLLVLPSYPVLGVLLVVASAGSGDWAALLRAAIGGVGLWGLYFLLAVVREGGMGFGDVKLAGLLGAAMAWLGWGPFAVGAFAAFLTGGLFGIALMLVRRAGRRSKVPFGPWMLLGAAIGVAWGADLWEAYTGLLM